MHLIIGIIAAHLHFKTLYYFTLTPPTHMLMTFYADIRTPFSVLKSVQYLATTVYTAASAYGGVIH